MLCHRNTAKAGVIKRDIKRDEVLGDSRNTKTERVSILVNSLEFSVCTLLVPFTLHLSVFVTNYTSASIVAQLSQE